MIKKDRPIVLSEYENKIVMSINTFGQAIFPRSEWRTLDRLESAGKVYASDPHGKDNNFKTATPRTE